MSHSVHQKSPQTNRQTSEIKNNNSAFSLPHNATPGKSAICSHGMYSYAGGSEKDFPFFFIKGLFFLKRRMSKTNAFYDCVVFPPILFWFFVKNALTNSCGHPLESPKSLRAPCKKISKNITGNSPFHTACMFPFAPYDFLIFML